MFSRQLATFIGAGVPITQALAVIAEETRSKSLRHALRQILEDLGSTDRSRPAVITGTTSTG